MKFKISADNKVQSYKIWNLSENESTCKENISRVFCPSLNIAAAMKTAFAILR